MKNIDSLISKVDLKELSHIKVGSMADVYFPKSYEDLKLIYEKFGDEEKFPIGGGSNTLFKDEHNKILISDKFLPKKIKIAGNIIKVSSNYNINAFLMKMAANNLGGLEFLAGIPANIGGLTFMNAGANNKEIFQFIDSVLVLENSGKQRLFRKDELNLNYRCSNIRGFILEVNFKLDIDSKENIMKKIAMNIMKRKNSQPIKKPNLGCFFKNPSGSSAGKLIDDLGLKGLQVGDAIVSDKHANFIINNGNASFQNIIYLTELIKQKVINQFNIKLELEIKIV